MGACATKPKVAKDGDIAPLPRPEPQKEAAAVAAEVKEENVVPVSNKEISEKDKIVDDDDQSSERRSLSNLLKENEPAKESAESEATTNQEKQEPKKPQNLVIKKRSLTLTPVEEVKQSELVEQVDQEPLKEKQPIPEISTDQPKKQDEKLGQQISKATTNQEKQESPDPQNPIIDNRSVVLNPLQEVKKSKIVEPAKLEQLETKEPLKTISQISIDQPEKQEEKTAQNTEEEKQQNIVTEKSLDPIEKQGSNVTEFDTPTAAVVDSATVFEKVIETIPEDKGKTEEATTTANENKTSQPEKEEKTEEATRPAVEIKTSLPEKEEKPEETK